MKKVIMKKIISLIIGSLLIFGAFKLMLPWHEFPFEHFEYKVAEFLPFNWKIVSIVSRLLIGLILVIACYLILYNKKIKWLKYLSILSISIPFILNPVFPEDLVDRSKTFSEDMPFELASLSKNETVLLAFFTNSCKYCREASLKLKTVQNKNKDFIKIIVVSDNYDLEAYFNENDINLPIDTTSFGNLLKVTHGAFPRFQLVENGKIIKNWGNSKFKYGVLDDLSNI